MIDRRAAVTLAAYLLPPLALMTAIFFMGSDTGSAEHSRGWLEEFLASLGAATRLSPAVLETANLALRKLGHFVTYAFLAILLARLARRLREQRAGEQGRNGASGPDGHLPRCPVAPLPRCYVWAWAWAGAVAQAAADEFHQSFFPSRGASVWDVGLDSLGAAAGIWLYRTWIRHRLRKRS